MAQVGEAAPETPVTTGGVEPEGEARGADADADA